MTKLMSVKRQNQLKSYIMIARGVMVFAFNIMAFNAWLWGNWDGAYTFVAIMVLMQFYIIALQTRVRRSRALYVKTYGASQPKTESYF